MLDFGLAKAMPSAGSDPKAVGADDPTQVGATTKAGAVMRHAGLHESGAGARSAKWTGAPMSGPSGGVPLRDADRPASVRRRGRHRRRSANGSSRLEPNWAVTPTRTSRLPIPHRCCTAVSPRTRGGASQTSPPRCSSWTRPRASPRRWPSSPCPGGRGGVTSSRRWPLRWWPPQSQAPGSGTPHVRPLQCPHASRVCLLGRQGPPRWPSPAAVPWRSRPMALASSTWVTTAPNSSSVRSTPSSPPWCSPPSRLR